MSEEKKYVVTPPKPKPSKFKRGKERFKGLYKKNLKELGLKDANIVEKILTPTALVETIGEFIQKPKGRKAQSID